MNRQLDVLFVSPDSSFQAYQALSKDFSAIEPPTWALLLAQSCRAKGFGVGILDCTAERLSVEESVKRIAEANPRLVCMVVYGQNPNSGTTNMIGATALARSLKQQHPGYTDLLRRLAHQRAAAWKCSRWTAWTWFCSTRASMPSTTCCRPT